MEGTLYFVCPEILNGTPHIVVFRDDYRPIHQGWFGIFMALKKETTGPETAWEMLIPTESGVRDNLNFYHFKLLEGGAARERSGSPSASRWARQK